MSKFLWKTTALALILMLVMGGCAPTPTPAPTPAPSEPTPETKTDREDRIEIFKANALANWGNDYEMVRYEIDNQTETYDRVV